MKIAIYGATGNIGSRITQEALSRGHEVTAIVRDPARLPLSHPQLNVVSGDISDSASIADKVVGYEAVINATSPGTDLQLNIANRFLEGLEQAQVKRLLVVGGAGSLEVAPGVQLLNVPEFPEFLIPIATWHRDQLEIYRQNQSLDWTYFSPPALIEAGERTGQYRSGIDQLVSDAQGNSRISYDDYAIALLDELEQPKHIRRRFTAAY